jgi:amidase
VQSFNDIFGQTNNPWNVDRVPGGSSGGAGAAVAAGFTSFELGTDIGGSVRIPSHWNGVFGLKPSFGVIPQRGYLDHPEGGTTDADVNVFGPIARSADDLELLLGVLAGPEPERAPAWRLELPPAQGSSLGDYRIGVWFDEPSCPLARDYRAVLQATVDRMADAGAKLEEAHPPVEFTAQVQLFSALIGAAMSPSLPEDIGQPLAGSHLDWLRRDIARARLRRTWAEWFETYDILLCPVTPSAALPHDHTEFGSRKMTIDGVERSYFDNVAWTGLIGVVGLPSAVPPIGRTAEGLPVGVQCVAPFLRDRDAVQLARLIGEYTSPPGF